MIKLGFDLKLAKNTSSLWWWIKLLFDGLKSFSKATSFLFFSLSFSPPPLSVLIHIPHTYEDFFFFTIKHDRRSTIQNQAIKCNVNTIAFTKSLEQALKPMSAINNTTVHAFTWLKFIYLHGLKRNDYNPAQHHTLHFFYEVCLSLINKGPPAIMSPSTAKTCSLVEPYRNQYITIANSVLHKLLNSQQTLACESKMMLTTYLNNIKNNFGNQLRRTVNIVLNVPPKIILVRLRAMLAQQRTGY